MWGDYVHEKIIYEWNKKKKKYFFVNENEKKKNAYENMK